MDLFGIILGLILLISVGLLIFRWYIIRPMYHGTARIEGKTVIITGGNTGIGKETGIDLVKRGARVIILCRDLKKGKIAAEEISGASGSFVAVYPLDLSDLKSIRQCAKALKEKEPKIDILINNAGVMTTPETKTKDGFELQFGTNHLGHFLLTLLLVDNIKAAAPSRIINVSSLAHQGGKMNWDDLHLKKGYTPMKAYAQSKLANVLFTKSLAQKLKGTGVTTYALHPGVVATELARHVREAYGSIANELMNVIKTFFSKTPLQGAQTTIYCAVDKSLAKESGKYYSGCKEKTPSARALKEADAEKLWKISLQMVGLGEDFSI